MRCRPASRRYAERFNGRLFAVTQDQAVRDKLRQMSGDMT
jgi:hypothetical protein